MNINNGKTGNVNIPGPLHSTGGDGDGQVGGVVAYAGDVYDETLGKNQKEINQTLLDGSGDSNVIAVALNDLNEKVEEQERVTSSGLNDLNDKLNNLDDKCIQKDEDGNIIILKKGELNLNNAIYINKKIKIRFIDDIDSFVSKYIKIIKASRSEEEITPEAENEYKRQLYAQQEEFKLFIIDNNEYQNLIISKIYDSNNNLIDETSIGVPGLGAFSKESPIVANTDYYINDFYTINENSINIFNLKKSGKLYLLGLGNYSGESNDNSNEESENPKSVQEVIFDLKDDLQNLDFKNNLKIDNEGNLVVHKIGSDEKRTSTESGFLLSNDYEKIYLALTYDPNSSTTPQVDSYTQEELKQKLVQDNLINPNYYYYIILDENTGSPQLIDNGFYSLDLGRSTVGFSKFISVKINETDVEISDYIEKLDNDDVITYIVIGLETEISNEDLSNVTMTFEHYPVFDKYISKINLNDGKLYLPGIGNYTVHNPNYNVSSVQEVLNSSSSSSELNDLNDKVDNLNDKVDNNEKTTASALNDLDEKTNTNERVVSAALNDLNNNVGSKLSLDNNNNLIINSKSEVESTATDSLIGGIATVGKGTYAFGFGGNASKAYISGNASDGYQLQVANNSSFDPTNFIRPIFENIYKDTYLLDANTYEKVAKITSVTPNTDDQKISITLDKNLGTLTNTLYRLENISKNKSFNFGVFGNTGDWSSILGYGSYNTGSYSNVLGSNNYNSKTYSTLLGTQNVNKGNYSTLIGYDNKVTGGTYPFAIGILNTINNNGYVVGRKNVIGSNNTMGYVFGYDNNANTSSAAFLLGQKLVCENSRGGYYIGQYNKEYISNDVAIANYFAIGCGDPNLPRQNAIEVKNNADIYVYGVGGFVGNNSDNSSIKSLNAVITDLTNRIIALETQLSNS